MTDIVRVELPRRETTHRAELEIHVRPGQRRRGIGRALHEAAEGIRRAEGRTTVGGELYVALDGDAPAGMAFARGLGFESVHEEEHLVLPLPVDPAALETLRRPTDGYEVVTWGDRCPDEHVEEFCRMYTQMQQDVPAGDVDLEPAVFDEPRLRTQEERLGRSYHQVVAVARRVADGRMAGYSKVFLPHDDRQALQDDTLVMPEHRGRGLGMQLKLAALDVLRAEHPDRRTLHTWTDPGNLAMDRTNSRFGYLPVERMHEMQRRDRHVGRA
jgi:GNAT superfamily N-acetyltransferase